jgi:NAD(P)H-dependent flavin oxidoreductase YrpB (nitropropane dioxygenase family)
MKKRGRVGADRGGSATCGNDTPGTAGKMSRREMLALSGIGGAALALGPAAAAAGAPLGSNGRISLDTRLTREYGVRFPFVGAGMGFVSMPNLVAAVSNAGGIGVLGNGIEPPPGTRALIRAVRSLTPGLFGVDFLFDDSAFGPLVTDAHIDVCVEERVPLVVFHMNVPPRALVNKLHQAGTRVWMQAGSVAQARAAVAIGMDAVIAQGSQAGGHNKSTTPTLELLRQILGAVGPRPIVLASGGIADGAAIVAALRAGAQGVWVGTRLVASIEAHAHPEYKQRLVQASGNATATTEIFGPEYCRPYRVLRNRIVRELIGKAPQCPAPTGEVIGHTLLFPLTLQQPYDMPKFSAVVPTPETTGDLEEMGLPAGAESVKLVKGIESAADIVKGMMIEAQELIQEAGGPPASPLGPAEEPPLATSAPDAVRARG